MRKLIRLSVVLAVLGAFLAIALLSASLYTFARLTDETLIAEVRFDAVAPERYLAHLSTGDFCRESTLQIEGDQWRIDAEFVKWHYWATLLGLDAQYRLDRFEGRYSDVDRQNRATDNSHALMPDTAIDLVTLADSLGRLNFLMDATYGSSTYQDIRTNQVYEVYRSQTGLFTRSRPRPAQPAAEGIEIEIRQACGGGDSIWRDVTAWVDRTTRSLL